MADFISVVNIAVAFVAAAAVFVAPPRQAFVVYLVALLFYPAFLTIRLGTVDFTVARILILVLLVNLIFRQNLLRLIRFSWLDVFILAAFVGRMLALFTNAPISTVIEREGGTFFHTVMPYAAARMVIRTRQDFVVFVKVLVASGVVLASLGAFEMFTSTNFYDTLRQYSHWQLQELEDHMRMGLYRSKGTMSVPIVFGLYFAATIPLYIGSWGRPVPPNFPAILTVMILGLGLFSSLSSAPFFAIVVALAWLAVYPFRHLWPYVLIATLLGAAAIELYSNRHFYHVLTRFAFSSQTGYYRIELIEEALGGGMRGHWLLGYGYVGVGPDADNSNFHWVHKDLVNIYVAKLARTGLVGLVPFLAVNIAYYFNLYRAGVRSATREDSWGIWCVAGALVGWNVAMLTVGPLSQTQNLLYIFIGLTGNLFVIFHPTAPGLEAASEKPDSRDPLGAPNRSNA